jgi:L-ascorbate metabolism protein UlaG (beta-lactamase superfamily)
MDIQFYGANCLRLTTKQASIVIDDNLSELGQKSILKADEIALYTALPTAHAEAKLIIADPGEYEVSGISIRGIAVRSHMDEPGRKTATVYRIDYDDVRLVVTGHIHPEITEDQLEAIGTVDILIVPVGGNGYTLDGPGALTVIKEIEPKIVIPTHFADPKLKYPVPQQDLAEALKGLAMEPSQTVAKYKVKAADFAEATQLIVLERQ